MALISIGKAAEIFGVHSDTLRNWEKRGKITSTRTKGNHRRYEEQDIKHCMIIEFWESIVDPIKCKEWFDFFLQNDGMMAASYDYARHKDITDETDILRFVVVCVAHHRFRCI